MSSGEGSAFCSGCHEKSIEELEAEKGDDWMCSFKNPTFWPLSGGKILGARLEEARPARRPEQWFRGKMMGGGRKVEVGTETNG